MKNCIVGMILLAYVFLLCVSVAYAKEIDDSKLRSVMSPDPFLAGSTVIGTCREFVRNVSMGINVVMPLCDQSLYDVYGRENCSLWLDGATPPYNSKNRIFLSQFNSGSQREPVPLGYFQSAGVLSLNSSFGRAQSASPLNTSAKHNATAVPEPTTMLLFVTGLVGLVGLMRRKSANKKHSES